MKNPNFIEFYEPGTGNNLISLTEKDRN